MRCLTLILTLALLPITRVAGQHGAVPGDSDAGPVIHGRTFSTGTLELAPIHQESPFYVAAGIGLITGHDLGLDKLVGWAQGTVAARTPIHELTPFVQVGRALVSGNRTEFLIGIAHPLAPYKLHFP